MGSQKSIMKGSGFVLLEGELALRAKKKAGKNGKLGINPVFPAYVLSLLKE